MGAVDRSTPRGERRLMRGAIASLLLALVTACTWIVLTRSSTLWSASIVVWLDNERERAATPSSWLADRSTEPGRHFDVFEGRRFGRRAAGGLSGPHACPRVVLRSSA
jgi:hypothetical protein